VNVKEVKKSAASGGREAGLKNNNGISTETPKREF
jgi:hypothetical protein